MPWSNNTGTNNLSMPALPTMSSMQHLMESRTQITGRCLGVVMAIQVTTTLRLSMVTSLHQSIVHHRSTVRLW